MFKSLSDRRIDGQTHRHIYHQLYSVLDKLKQFIDMIERIDKVQVLYSAQATIFTSEKITPM